MACRAIRDVRTVVGDIFGWVRLSSRVINSREIDVMIGFE